MADVRVIPRRVEMGRIVTPLSIAHATDPTRLMPVPYDDLRVLASRRAEGVHSPLRTHG
jgi:hypothetical protein